MIVAYTWSKALDTKSSVGQIGGGDAGWAGPQDGHNISAEYARGNFDVGQRLAFSAVYSLPVGRGQALFGHSNRLVDEAVGGWKLGVIGSLQGGLPFTIGATDIQSANNTYSERANINPIPGSFHKSLKQWYVYDSTPGSTDQQFTQPAPGQYGNSARDALRAPGQINADLSLGKTFPIWETANFEFKFDAFNAFNHWNPGQPGLVQDATGNSTLWRHIDARTDRCAGRSCPSYDTCFVTMIREKANESHLVIINHHLFFTDLTIKMKAPDASILPAAHAVVFDQAHEIEHAASDCFGLSVRNRRIGDLANDIVKAFAGAKTLAAVQPTASDLVHRLAMFLEALPGELNPERLFYVEGAFFSHQNLEVYTGVLTSLKLPSQKSDTIARLDFPQAFPQDQEAPGWSRH